MITILLALAFVAVGWAVGDWLARIAEHIEANRPPPYREIGIGFDKTEKAAIWRICRDFQRQQGREAETPAAAAEQPP